MGIPLRRPLGNSGVVLSFPGLVLALWCCALAYVDVTRLRLPNALTLSGGVVVLAYGVATGRGLVVGIGAVLLAGLYLVVHLAAPAALGAGDVKAAVGLGGAAALGGAEVWVCAAIWAPLATALTGAALFAIHRRSAVLPHGAFMSAATVAALVAGP